MLFTKEKIVEILEAAERDFRTARVLKHLSGDLLEALAEIEQLRTFQREAILEVARLKIELDDYAGREKDKPDEADEGTG